MSTITYYYTYQNDNYKNSKDDDLSKYDVKVQNIKVSDCFAKGEQISLKSFLFRQFLAISAYGKAKVVSIYFGDELSHISLVIPRCFKFPFLQDSEYEIGPCYTTPKYRGKGIYPFAIKWILLHFEPNAKYYMFVDSSNKASIKGIEKSGFLLQGKARIDKLKRYHLIKESKNESN